MTSFYRPGFLMIVMRSARSARCAIWLTLVCRAGLAQAQASEWEGAIGPLLSNAPAYAGAADRRTKLLPGFYLRHGRFSVTNASGFIARNNEEVVRGLGMDLSPHGALKVSLGLRFDGGRSESTSGALSGLGSIRPTLRARLAARWLADEHWRVGGAFSVDALGRGGGHLSEISLSREQRWSPSTTWIFGGSTTLAGARYMQTYFGVTTEQAGRTAYAPYTPGSGPRDVTLFANLRSQLGPRWVALAGVSATRLLGPAADSPLSFKPASLAVTGGVAWSF